MHDLQGTPVITRHISAHIALVTTPVLRVGYVLEILGAYIGGAIRILRSWTQVVRMLISVLGRPKYGDRRIEGFKE